MPENSNGTAVRKRVPGRPFEKGQSGNPGGRKKQDPAVKAMLQAALPDAVQLLIDTMGDEQAKPDLRVQCANTIIDRVMGKAAQPIQADVFQAAKPLTLTEMLAEARDVLAGLGEQDAGGGG